MIIIDNRCHRHAKPELPITLASEREMKGLSFFFVFVILHCVYVVSCLSSGDCYVI